MNLFGVLYIIPSERVDVLKFSVLLYLNLSLFLDLIPFSLTPSHLGSHIPLADDPYRPISATITTVRRYKFEYFENK